MKKTSGARPELVRRALVSGAGVLLGGALGSCRGPSEERRVPIPAEFKTVTFSNDAAHVAFGVEQEDRYRVVVDGRPEPLYANVTVVAFSPDSDHYFYGGERDGKWYLLRDGEEIAELGRLTNLVQGTGLHLMGENMAITMWYPLPIWMAVESDNYFVICYQDGRGRILKDGDWLSVRFASFWRGGSAFSPDGQRYSFAVGNGSARMHIDGVGGPEFDSVGNAAYLQPGNRLVYRGRLRGTSTLMAEDKPLPGYGGAVAAGPIVSPDGRHLAALIEREDGGLAVVVDAEEEQSFPAVEGSSGDGSLQMRSFTWAKKGPSHAYAVYLTADKAGPSAVVHNGKLLGAHAEIRDTSLALGDGGQRLAYAARESGVWTIVLDEAAEGSHEDVGDPVLYSGDRNLAYAARAPSGWTLMGLPDSGLFRKIGPLAAGPSRIAYAAQLEDEKWQVFLGAEPVHKPYDGIVRETGIRFDSSGVLRFVAKEGNQLVWVRAQ